MERSAPYFKRGGLSARAFSFCSVRSAFPRTKDAVFIYAEIIHSVILLPLLTDCSAPADFADTLQNILFIISVLRSRSIMRVEQIMRFVTARFTEKFIIELFDIGIVVAFAQRKRFILAVNCLSSLSSYICIHSYA